MHNNKKQIIKYLGILFIIVGSLQLILRVKDIWWAIEALFRPGSFMSFQEYLIFSTTFLLFGIVLPIAILIAGYGLMRFKRWGWILAMIVCVITFVSHLYSTVWFAIVSYQSRNLPMPKIPEGYHVGYISMWPTYIYALISALLILVLKRQSLRQEFNKT